MAATSKTHSIFNQKQRKFNIVSFAIGRLTFPFTNLFDKWSFWLFQKFPANILLLNAKLKNNWVNKSNTFFCATFSQ